MFNHYAFKHSKFVCLSSNDKNSYLSFKLQNYFNTKNNFCPDITGMSQKIYTHQVCVSDFYNQITQLFEPSYKLVEHNRFIGKPIQINDTIKRLLKQHDLEHAFRNCFEIFIAPVFSKLKEETDAKKQLEIIRIDENRKLLEENEKKILKQQIEKKNAEKEKEIKLANLRASVLSMGAEWEDE